MASTIKRTRSESTNVQIVEVELPENPELSVNVLRRQTKDLPDHVAGQATWTSTPASQRGYYALIRYSDPNKRDHYQAVEFIRVNGEDDWYYLEAENDGLSWNTWASHRIPRKNNVGVGWWKLTDPQHPDYRPSESTTPVEEALSGGLHHIATLRGSHPLTHEEPPHILPQIIQAAEEGIKIPTDIPPAAATQSTTMSLTQQANRTQTSGSNGGPTGSIPVFDGDRKNASTWMDRFKIYKIANKNKEQMTNPYLRVGTALMHIAGPLVNAWAVEQSEKLEHKITIQRFAETDEQLWKDFESDFKTAYTDLADQPRAHQELLNLRMGGTDLDTYNAEFNRLYKIAGFTENELGTIELYKKGLTNGLLEAIIDNYTKKPKTLAEWQEEARSRQLRWLEKRNAIKPMGLSPRELKMAQMLNMRMYKGTQIPPATPPPWSRNDQVVKMDVDAVRFKGQMTDEERDLCFKENRCFKCKKQGHRSRDCRSGQPPQNNNQTNQRGGWSGVTGRDKDRGRGPPPQARTTEIEETEPEKDTLTNEEWLKYLPNAPDPIKEQFLDKCFAQDFLEAQN